MGGMQTKLLASITEAVKGANPDLEVVNQPKWANMGDLYVQPQNGFDTVLQIKYDFQDAYATIGLSHHALAFAGENQRRADGSRWGWIKGNNCNGALDGPAFHHLDYVDTPRIKMLLDLVKRTVAGDNGDVANENAAAVEVLREDIAELWHELASLVSACQQRDGRALERITAKADEALRTLRKYSYGNLDEYSLPESEEEA